MKNGLKQFIAGVTLSGLLLFTPSSSEGDVTVNWAQVGDDVVATYSGNVGVSEFYEWESQYDSLDLSPFDFNAVTQADALIYTGGGTAFRYMEESRWFYGDSMTGDSFSFSSNAIFWKASVGTGSLSGTVTFEYETLEDMGLWGLDNFKAFEMDDKSFAVYYKAVPEPSFIAAMGIGILGAAAFVRRRKG